MNIGIYKWVSPSNRVYVGQSKDLKYREYWYRNKNTDLSSMPKIKRSFEKYGVDNHEYSIIEYCSIELLNEREIYWGIFYNVLEEGLNCKLGEQNAIFSVNTRNLMSKAKLGTKQSEETKRKKGESIKRFYQNKTPLIKILKSSKPKNRTQEVKDKISKAKLGKPIHTIESKEKLRIIGKDRDMTSCYQAGIESRKIPIIQFDKNMNFIKIWDSASEAELVMSKRGKDNIRACIRGKQKTAYKFIWKQLK